MLRKLSLKVLLSLLVIAFSLTLSGVEIWTDGHRTVAEVPREHQLKFAAWNIQRFGQDGKYHRDKNEMREIVKILHKYDLIAITELMKEKELQRAQKLLSQMGREYDYLISREVGWIGDHYQEHYAFLYDKKLISVVPDRETGEEKGSLYEKPIRRPELDKELRENFIRPPFWATFRADKFDFSVIVVHTQPKRSKEECELMDEVYKRIQKKNGEESDILLVGDFNLEPTENEFTDLLEIKDKDEDRSTMIFLINEKDHRSTMVNFKKINDNIFFEKTHLSEYLDCGVDEFDKRDLGGVPAKYISDHRPVWATFRIDGRDDD
ncbi:hypothetical protein F4X10_06485 [Candidatus Poribacteria bacterium]|nr:hypothetical protein [Candidatus Poribacteria bacterium]